MKIKYQNGSVLGGKKIEEDGVAWVVVYDEHDQPIAALEQVTDGTVYVTTCSDEKFHAVIRRYGIDKMPRTEVVNDRS